MKTSSDFKKQLCGVFSNRTSYQTERYLHLIAEILIAIYSVQEYGLTPLGADAGHGQGRNPEQEPTQ